MKTYLSLSRRFLPLLAVLFLSQSVAPVLAAEAKAAKTSDADGGEEGDDEQEEPRYVTFDLGEFRLREFHPTRNETSKLLFAVSLKLNEETSESTLKHLEKWKQRLRNETLTAVRSLHLADYQAPDLDRLQKVMRLRINRMLPVPLVERIFVTEFTVGDH